MPVEDFVLDQPSKVVVGIVGTPYHSATRYPRWMMTICQGPWNNISCFSLISWSLSGSIPPSLRTSSGVLHQRQPPADSGGGTYAWLNARFAPGIIINNASTHFMSSALSE